MKLVLSFKKQHYDEVPQFAKCKFAYCLPIGDEIHVQHAPVKCRDFLCDTLSWLSGEIDLDDEENSEVYGYNFKAPIDPNYLVLGVFESGNLEKNLGVVQELERSMGIKPTEIFHKEGKSLVVLADNFWKSATVHLSWYTQVLRVLTYAKDVDSFSDLKDWLHNEEIDDVRAFDAFFKMPEVLKNLKVIKVCSAAANDIETIHNYSGWQSVVSEYKSMFTHYGKAVNELIAA
jgi:hypothetical protein